MDLAKAYMIIVSSIPALYRRWKDAPNEVAVYLHRMLLDEAIAWCKGYQSGTGRTVEDFSEYQS